MEEYGFEIETIFNRGNHESSRYVSSINQCILRGYCVEIFIPHTSQSETPILAI
jgi:hypothetical protein